MRVIVTGGTGLIGRALSSELLDGGYEVVVLSRSPERAPLQPEGVRLVAWDAKTSQGWGHLVDGAFALIHLSGANLAGEHFFPSRWTQKRKQLIRDSRVQTSQAVIQAISEAQHKPEVVVQASAIGYYGYSRDEIFSELDAPGEDWGARFVAETWEPSTQPVEAMGVRRILVRSGVVLSRQGGALLRLLLPFKLYAGGRMGTGEQWMSWIHIKDEVRALRFLIETKDARGVYNLTAPNPVQNKTFAKTMGRILHRPSFIPVPGFMMRLAFGEVADVVLKGQQVHPQRLLDMGFQYLFPTLEAALMDLFA